MTDFTFTDRASWLSFRADWRLRYKEASQTIRDAKSGMRRLHADRRATPEEAARERIDWQVSSAQSTLAYLRRDARDLMNELDEAKERKAELMAEKTSLAA